MTRTIHIITVCLLLVGGAVAHGYLTDRWNWNTEQLKKIEQMLGMPADLDDWAGADVTVDPKQLPPGVKTFCRRYSQPGSGRSMLVSVAVGRPGFVSTHTPEFCYVGSGYELTTAIEREDVGPSRFYAATFSKPRPTGTETIRLRWAWSADGRWLAPQLPRIAFAREPVLLKLYLVRNSPGTDKPEDAAAYDRFAERLVQALNARAFPDK